MNNQRNIRGGIAVALASLALVAAGCGSDDEGGADSPEEAVSTLYTAVGDGDAEAACAVLSNEAQDQAAEAGGGSCEDYVQQSIDSGAGELLSGIEVGEADVDGDSGTVATDFAGTEDTVDVVKEDGTWRVDEAT